MLTGHKLIFLEYYLCICNAMHDTKTKYEFKMPIPPYISSIVVPIFPIPEYIFSQQASNIKQYVLKITLLVYNISSLLI